MATSVSLTGTVLLCVIAPSPLELENGESVDETGAVVVDDCRAKDASRSLSLSPVSDCDASELDVCPLSDSVTLGIAVIADVAEVGVASASRSCEDNGVRVSCKASSSEVKDSALVVVTLVKTKRLISFLMNRGLSTSSRGCAGAAAAKHVAESSVDSNARDAANITGDLQNMVDVEYDEWVDLYYVNRLVVYMLLTPSSSSDVIFIGMRQALTVRTEFKRVNLTSQG